PLTGLNGPSALAVDAAGNLYVANFNGGTVSVFAPGSTAPTATLTGLRNPQALAVDARGNLFVANGFNGFGGSRTEVSVFARDGTPFAISSGLNDPTALAFDAHGNLYVANGVANTVSKFAPSPAAGGVVVRTAQPNQDIHVGADAGTGLALSNAALAQIFTT